AGGSQGYDTDIPVSLNPRARAAGAGAGYHQPTTPAHPLSLSGDFILRSRNLCPLPKFILLNMNKLYLQAAHSKKFFSFTCNLFSTVPYTHIP
ncbi:MAG: hypothetical protein RML37_11025, partial [Chitinophagales bacterium]|nr:hypothetical protein [Chitinophagales bacterium]